MKHPDSTRQRTRAGASRSRLLGTLLASLLAACSGKLGSDSPAPSGFGPMGDGAGAEPSGTEPNMAGPAGTGSNVAPRVTDDGVVVDDQGNPLSDADGNPLAVNMDGVVVDGNGEPVTDDAGNPVVVGGTPTAPSEPPEPPTVGGGQLADCSTPGPRQLRRLTSEQYDRTLQAIFSDPNVPQEAVLSDASVLGFHVDSRASVVRDLEGELLLNHAERVADWAVESGKLGQFGCTQQTEQCQREFVVNFGQKAHREPLPEQRVSAYIQLFEGEASFEDGARGVISAMLQSPYTLYRRELGAQQGGQFQLSPFELASQLSYWLTNAPPDAALYDAAQNGRLNSSDDLMRETARLLETEAARETLAQFVEGWLHLDKLGSKAKDESIMPLPDELRDSMVQETRELFLSAFREDASLEDLFTARHSFVDQRLASLYGLGGGSQGFDRVDLTGTDRPGGLLGHAAFLTTHALSDNSSPVQRGKVVIERLLCGELPPVPPGLDTSLDTETEFLTNRERYEEHRRRDECRTCHENMDPIGYAFENYDAFGRYRSQENGMPVDASGSLNLLASGPVALDGVDSLSQALAQSPEVQECLVHFWSYYTFGAEGWQGAECTQDGVVRHAREQGFTLKSVLHGLVQSPHFSSRVADQ